MAELASALRNWRRHFGRAREVGPSLPDGTLLLRALEKENSQAAFRLALSRAALHVDEQPSHSLPLSGTLANVCWPEQRPWFRKH